MEDKEENEQKQSLEEGFWDREAPPVQEAARAPKQNRGRNIFIVLGALLLAVIVFFVGWFARYYSLSEEERNILWILDRVKNDYYKEMSDQEWNEYYDKVYDGLMPDQFCTFYDKEEFADLLEEAEGNNSDTGLSAFMDGDTPKVFMVNGNSPADLAGLKSGMTIFRYGKDENSLQAAGSVNEIGTFVQNNRGAFSLECGYSAEDKAVYRLESKAYLASYCSYSDSGATYVFRTVSTEIDGKINEKLELQPAGEGLKGLDADTGYIRYQGFDGNSAWEFEECLKQMVANGKKNLVIDLRCNGGGYLDLFRDIASHLLRNAEGSGPMVAYAVDRDGKKSEFYATGNNFGAYFDQDSRITVLADEYSASASECLIGALFDYGTIGYGDIYLRKDSDGDKAHSYGKGVMQSTYITAGGGGLRITSAEIFWPKGNSIHGKGVTEDDGAHGIVAPLVRGSEDVFLQQVFAALQA